MISTHALWRQIEHYNKELANRPTTVKGCTDVKYSLLSTIIYSYDPLCFVKKGKCEQDRISRRMGEQDQWKNLKRI